MVAAVWMLWLTLFNPVLLEAHSTCRQCELMLWNTVFVVMACLAMKGSEQQFDGVESCKKLSLWLPEHNAQRDDWSCPSFRNLQLGTASLALKQLLCPSHLHARGIA